jgi:hypothetical protein
VLRERRHDGELGGRECGQQGKSFGHDKVLFFMQS